MKDRKKEDKIVCVCGCGIESKGGVPVVAQWLTNPTRNHGVAGSVPGLAQWVKRIWCCHELWCGLQTRLGSHVAVALA